MEKFMYRLFTCLFSIIIILDINSLLIEFSLSTLVLLVIDILVLVLLISNQRMKKKIVKKFGNSKISSIFAL